MKIYPALFIVLLAGVANAPVRGQDAKLSAATVQIQERIQKSGADVGIAFRMLDGTTEWFFHADEPFHAASTMKIPVLIELFHQVREGKLKLDDPLPIKNEFHSLVDGSVYTLDAADDSEAELYQAVGQT
ncbi:MAG: serine hydrolase, partial [Candidatus Acidiferrum sp.]